MKTEYIFVSADRALELIHQLWKKINGSFEPDCLVGISRGGLWVVRNLSDFLDISEIYIIRLIYYRGVQSTNKEPQLIQDVDEALVKGKKVLLVDDVADTGESLVFAANIMKQKGVKELKTATLHYKPWSKIKPDFYIDETSKWIIYPWEIREMVKCIMGRKDLTENEKMSELDKTGMPKDLTKEFLEEMK